MAIRKRGDSWQVDYIDPNGKRVRKPFKKKRAGIEDFHFHDLRHTFSSRVIMRGGSL
ncbi:MAG: hypothetical protein PVH82_16755 [Desulfobacteraceae bacterium]|jgi:integrase